MRQGDNALCLYYPFPPESGSATTTAKPKATSLTNIACNTRPLYCRDQVQLARVLRARYMDQTGHKDHDIIQWSTLDGVQHMDEQNYNSNRDGMHSVTRLTNLLESYGPSTLDTGWQSFASEIGLILEEHGHGLKLVVYLDSTRSKATVGRVFGWSDNTRYGQMSTMQMNSCSLSCTLLAYHMAPRVSVTGILVCSQRVNASESGSNLLGRQGQRVSAQEWRRSHCAHD